MTRSHLLRLAPATLPLLAACAAGPPPRTTLLSDTHPPRGRTCVPASDPVQLPAPATLLDAQRFRAQVAQLWHRSGAPAGYVILSLRHSPDGAQVRRAVIESTAPADFSDSVAAYAFEDRREAPPARAEWGVRLRVDLGDSLAIRVGRRENCAAAPGEWAYRTMGSPFDVREGDALGMSYSMLTDPTIAWIRVKLDRDGNVVDAQVERAPGRGQYDQRLLNYARTMAFYPATEDGYPVPAELVVPIRLAVAR